MPHGTAAQIGTVLQWTASFLWLLLFYRLGRAGTHRRMLWTWAAAWGAQCVAAGGFAVQAIAMLAGHPVQDAATSLWLDGFYPPGTLMFAALVAVALAQTIGRRLTLATERRIVVGAIVIGVVVALLDQPAVTGAVVMLATVVVFFGGLAAVPAERRMRGRRLLFPGGMVLLGLAMLLVQATRFFGTTLDPFGDFRTVILGTGGYAGAFTSAVLAAAILVLITEDGARARDFLQYERFRQLEASLLPVAPDEPAAAEPAPEAKPAAEAAADEEEAIPATRSVAPAPPVARSDETDHEPLRAPVLNARTPTLPRPARRSDGGAPQILLVDDEAATRSTLVRIFQRGGWTVREAATGAEALSWLLDVDGRDAPEVVVCDLMTPGVGGREMYAHLQRQRPEFLRRLIFLTSRPDAAPTVDFIRKSGCQLVRKPVSVQDVARAVEAALT